MNIKKGLIAVAILTLTLVVSLGSAVPSTSDWLSYIVSETNYKDICVHEAYAMITYKMYPNLTILDVRTQSEYDEGHIAGAIHIPYDQLEANLSDPPNCPLIGSENNITIVYCKVGGRSAIASAILATHSFLPVYNMLGGITAWTNPAWNYPVVTGPPPTYTTIGVDDAYLMITEGSPDYGFCNIVVDVRGQTDYNNEHIVNSTEPTILHAINIPYDTDAGFASRIGPLLGHENDPIILYCVNNDCTKSVSACTYLVNNGFKKVYNLDGGIEAWKVAGRPTLPTSLPPLAFSDGFESGDFSAWTGTSVSSGETLAVVDTQNHHGTYSCHASCAMGGRWAYAYKTLSYANSTLYMRVYVQLAVDLVNNGQGIVIMRMASSSGSGIFTMRIRKTGGNYVLEIGNWAEGKYYMSAPFSIALNTWYCAELQGHIGASTGWFKGLWQGETKIDESGKNTGTTNIQRVHVGIDYCWESSASDIYIDCVAVSDSPIGCEG